MAHTVILALLFGLSCTHGGGATSEDGGAAPEGLGLTGSDPVDGGSDQVSENDGDASSETTASDTSPRDTDCPLGSGWPCTCSLGAGNYCDDDSPCVPLPGGAPGLGVCLASCDPSLDLPPLQLCPATDYPAPGWCRMRQNPTGDATHCLLTCAGSFARTCPPDQQCHVETEGQMGFCVPKP